MCKKEKMIIVQPERVTIGNGSSFGCVLMKDFLLALAKKVKRNTTSFDNYLRMYVPPGVPLKQKPNESLKTVNLYKHIQVHFTSQIFKLTVPESLDLVLLYTHFMSSELSQ